MKLRKRMYLCTLALVCLLVSALPAAQAVSNEASVTAVSQKQLRLGTNGWKKAGGKWYYYENGKQVKNAWRKDSKGWVYLGADGAMVTNRWVRDAKGWCYVETNGYCATNIWKRDSVGWVYLDSEGSMVKSRWIFSGNQWYYLDGRGYMVTNRWQKDSVGWCWLTASGAMATNTWVRDSKGWCYVEANGYCATNTWKQDSVGWVYLDSEGSMVYDQWIQSADGRRYVDSRGYMLKSCQKDGGCIDADGIWRQHQFFGGVCVYCEITSAQRDEAMPKKLLIADVAQLPVASEEMTTDERRQLCLDYFELQLGFQWQASMDVLDWDTTYYDKGSQKELLTENIYGGIPYQSTGMGNLYRWLEYYDEATGTMDLERAFAENGGYGDGAAVTGVKKDEQGNVTYKKYRSFQTLFNQCSMSASWGWGRVINSANFAYTGGINAYNGYIPLGCYSYGYDYEGKHYGLTEISTWGEVGENNPTGYDTSDVVKDLLATGGEDALFACYAQLKPADCVVNTGHVRMVKSVHLAYHDDGTPNYTDSYVICIEQIEGWGIKDGLIGDRGFWQQGGIDRVYSFEALQKSNYIPFTFREFLDENDPQDKKHLDYYNSYADKLTILDRKYSATTPNAEDCGGGVEKARLYSTLDRSEGTITLAELRAMSVGSNYWISDVFVTVTDDQGNLLHKNTFRAMKTTNDREVSMTENNSTWEKDANGKLLDMTAGLEKLSGNTVEITVRVSTGETLTAFRGTLVS